MTTILMVQEDNEILQTSRNVLESMGYHVLVASTLAASRRFMKYEIPDLIILDVLIPDGRGLDYCAELRENSTVPILLLSEPNTSWDVVAGLHAGGDYYFTKPYNMDVFQAQVKAMLRRYKFMECKDTILSVGTLKLDTVSRRAHLDGKDILLKPKELALLEILMRRKGEYITAEDLYEKVWSMDTTKDTRTVKEHISRLRQKVGVSTSFVIETKRGKGYCFKKII